MPKKKKPIPQIPQSPKIELLCQTRTLLKRAVTFITPERWIQGTMYRDGAIGQPQTKVCAVGSLHQANHTLAFGSSVINKAQDVLNEHTPVAYGEINPIVRYNDHYAENSKDVKKVFLAAIKDVEKQIQEEAGKG